MESALDSTRTALIQDAFTVITVRQIRCNLIHRPPERLHVLDCCTLYRVKKNLFDVWHQVINQALTFFRQAHKVLASVGSITGP